LSNLFVTLRGQREVENMLNKREDVPSVTFHSPHGHLRNLRQIEADIICPALIHCGGHLSKIARYLAIGRTTLHRTLDALGMNRG
jgi:DNA-binding NtrC family response regulator